MKTPRIRVARTIARVTLKNGLSKEYAREIASYLLAERRTGELGSLLRDIQAEWADSGYVEAAAASAHPLDETAKQEISRQVRQYYPHAKKVVVSETQEPSLVGGVRVNLPDAQLDLSLRAKLNKFKQLTT